MLISQGTAIFMMRSTSLDLHWARGKFSRRLNWRLSILVVVMYEVTRRPLASSEIYACMHALAAIYNTLKGQIKKLQDVKITCTV